MKLLIVDDEDIIREGLVLDIPWKENGFELVTPGKNGREAIEIIGKEHPDIVLADINMPFMDGLELAQWIRENEPEIQVIFLTGYDEFRYAKKAIELRARDYILKFEKRDLLLQKVKNVAEQMKVERAGERLQNQARIQLVLQTVSDLIIGVAKIDTRPAVLERLGLKNREWEFCLAVLDAALDTPVDEDKPNENGLYLFSYINVAREVCRFPGVQVICGSYDNQIYALFAAENGKWEELEEKVKQAVSETCEKFHEFLKVSAKAGISRIYSDIFQTDIAYNSAYMALQLSKKQNGATAALAEEEDCGPANSNEIMKEIENFIQTNYTSAGLSLNDLADAIHLSPSHLCRLIKKYENTNFMTWLTEVRIQMAAKLIRNTDLKIYEICDRVGYNNPQYFSVVFKKYMGCSPREYK